jgi:hypothetical protein
VSEAIFSVEATLVETREFESRVTPGKKTSVLAIVEGLQFWVREDAINEAADYVDPAVSACMLVDGAVYGSIQKALHVTISTNLDLIRFCVL